MPRGFGAEINKLNRQEKLKNAKELTAGQQYDLECIRSRVVAEAIATLQELLNVEESQPIDDGIFDIESLAKLDPNAVAHHNQIKHQTLARYQNTTPTPKPQKVEALGAMFDNNLLSAFALQLAITFLIERRKQAFTQSIENFINPPAKKLVVK